MVEQERVILLTLPKEEAAKIKNGVNLVSKSEGEKYIIFKDPDEDEMKACRNKCKHQEGTFIKDIEDTAEGCIVKCTKHGWKLNAKTMRYSNPPDSFTQEQLVAEIDDDGQLNLVELQPSQPWTHDKRERQPLQVGEVKLTFFAHACMEFNFNGTIMFTDPWLTGPAFARGWWLMHEPPADWLDRLEKADFIYVSHLHPDHLSYPTLALLSKRNPNIPIYVGDVSIPVFSRLKYSGVELNNINVLKFGVWKEINKDLRFMILMDGVFPDMDTCLLVDYKGHLILNTVDCNNPNGGRLPNENVAVMLSDFAGGATGYPLTFYGGIYTGYESRGTYTHYLCYEWKKQYVKIERNKLLYYKTQVIRDVKPNLFVPFAGYFIEAHPSDIYIKTINTKNDPAYLGQLIKKYSPEIESWTPVPGAVLDLQKVIQRDSNFVTPPPPGTKVFKDTWEFDKYVDEINKSVFDEIFAYPDWVSYYYNWSDFHSYNLVLRMIETDDLFEPIEGGYDYLVDFIGSKPTYPTERPSREHNYLEIKIRIGVHRQTVKYGMTWDSLYIGYNTRLHRTPDIFHYLFWTRHQICLPVDPPDWDAFLKERKSAGAPRKEVWKPSNVADIAGKPVIANGESASNHKTAALDSSTPSTITFSFQHLKWLLPAACMAAVAYGTTKWMAK